MCLCYKKLNKNCLRSYILCDFLWENHIKYNCTDFFIMKIVCAVIFYMTFCDFATKSHIKLTVLKYF